MAQAQHVCLGAVNGIHKRIGFISRGVKTTPHCLALRAAHFSENWRKHNRDVTSSLALIGLTGKLLQQNLILRLTLERAKFRLRFEVGRCEAFLESRA